jgi:polar amino acid transport system substrate-binding protein
MDRFNRRLSLDRTLQGFPIQEMISFRFLPALAGVAGAAIISLVISGCGQGTSPSPSQSGNTSVRPLRWGNDEAGGAPFVFRDPQNPRNRIGFETEIVEELGKRMGRPIEFVQTEWPSLIPALNRGDFDFALAAIEVTPERVETVLFSRPYYVYSQQLVVRQDDPATSLSDMIGRRVGTLAATAAERILQDTPGIEIVRYDDNTRPYDELIVGRLDGVLLDLPLAIFYGRPRPQLRFAGEPFADGFYAAAFRKNDGALRDEISKHLDDMIADGTIRRIIQRYDLDGPLQDKLTSATAPN